MWFHYIDSIWQTDEGSDGKHLVNLKITDADASTIMLQLNRPMEGGAENANIAFSSVMVESLFAKTIFLVSPDCCFMCSVLVCASVLKASAPCQNKTAGQAG